MALIASFAASGGNTKVTDADGAVKLLPGESVVITDTINYNGTHVVVASSEAAGSFDIPIPYTPETPTGLSKYQVLRLKTKDSKWWNGSAIIEGDPLPPTDKDRTDFGFQDAVTVHVADISVYSGVGDDAARWNKRTGSGTREAYITNYFNTHKIAAAQSSSYTGLIMLDIESLQTDAWRDGAANYDASPPRTVATDAIVSIDHTTNKLRVAGNQLAKYATPFMVSLEGGAGNNDGSYEVKAIGFVSVANETEFEFETVANGAPKNLDNSTTQGSIFRAPSHATILSDMNALVDHVRSIRSNALVCLYNSPFIPNAMKTAPSGANLTTWLSAQGEITSNFYKCSLLSPSMYEISNAGQTAENYKTVMELVEEHYAKGRITVIPSIRRRITGVALSSYFSKRSKSSWDSFHTTAFVDAIFDGISPFSVYLYADDRYSIDRAFEASSGPFTIASVSGQVITVNTLTDVSGSLRNDHHIFILGGPNEGHWTLNGHSVWNGINLEITVDGGTPTVSTTGQVYIYANNSNARIQERANHWLEDMLGPTDISASTARSLAYTTYKTYDWQDTYDFFLAEGGGGGGPSDSVNAAGSITFAQYHLPPIVLAGGDSIIDSRDSLTNAWNYPDTSFKFFSATTTAIAFLAQSQNIKVESFFASTSAISLAFTAPNTKIAKFFKSTTAPAVAVTATDTATIRFFSSTSTISLAFTAPNTKIAKFFKSTSSTILAVTATDIGGDVSFDATETITLSFTTADHKTTKFFKSTTAPAVGVTVADVGNVRYFDSITTVTLNLTAADFNQIKLFDASALVSSIVTVTGSLLPIDGFSAHQKGSGYVALSYFGGISPSVH